MSIYNNSEIRVPNSADEDDWDTDPDYVNDLSEKDQRKGSALIQPGQDAGVIDLKQLRADVNQEDSQAERHVHSSVNHRYGAQ